MPTPRASIRLTTDGKAQVQRDLADIGDTGDAQARRYATAWERASAQATAAREREAKAAQRLASLTSGATNNVNPITGGSYARADGVAQASARAIDQQMRDGEAAARRLLAAVDPLFAAQMRYNSALEEATLAQRTGALSAQQFAQVQTGLKAQLDQQVGLYGKVGTSTGNARIAQMEFMHAVRGSADQLAAGASPVQVFAMHMGMLSQSAQLAGGSLGKVGEFLSSGLGIAVVLAVAVLAPLIAKLAATGDTVDSLVDKLKKEAQQNALNDQAHRAFAATLDGVREAARKNEEALKGLADQGKTQAENVLKNTLVELGHAAALRASTKAQLDNARAMLEAQRVQASGPGQRGELAALGLPGKLATLDFLERQLAGTDAAIAAAQDKVDRATAAVYAEAAVRDPVERIKRQYEGPRGLIALATQQATAEEVINGKLTKRIQLLKAEEDARIKAEQDRDKKPGVNAGGTAIFNDQIADFFGIAAKYRGLSETGDRATLQRMLGNVDPEKTAWCAAFVNAVLAMGGVTGTGSLAASSFLGFGKDDTHSPQKGDIVIVRSGGSPSGMHVGFLDSIDSKGNVSILGGNTGNKVGEATYKASDVLGVRRPNTPAEEFGDQADLTQRLANALFKDLHTEQEVAVVKEHQVQSAEEYLALHTSLNDLINGGILPALKDWDREFEQMMASAEEFKNFAGGELDQLFNIDNWKNWRDLGLSVLHDLEQELVKLALLNPLKNWLLGQNNPTIGGVFQTILSGIGAVAGGLAGGGGAAPVTGLDATPLASVPVNWDSILAGLPGGGFATGTEYAPGGLAWVGEHGRELVRLPRGSRVTPAAESRRLAAANDGHIGSITVPVNIDATGADAAGLARVEAKLDQLREELPGHIVATVEDARSRNVFRF